MIVGGLLRYTRGAVSLFFFSSRRRHTRCSRDWSSDVCSSDLSSFPTVRLRRLRSTPTVEVHSTVVTSRAMERQSLFRVRVKERTSTPGWEMTFIVCLVRGMLRRFPLATGISSPDFLVLKL